jgi:phytanoyl-CoA hydroxylase
MDKIKTFFDDKGYYLAKGLFEEEEINHLEKEFDRIVNQLKKSEEKINATWKGKSIKKLTGKNDFIIHTHNVHQYSSKWLSAMKNKEFINITKSILGEDIILHHNKLFQKPPQKGSAFPMHQDWSYFPTINDTMIAAVIHLSKTTSDMGCFRIYEGTHKLGRLENTGGQSEKENEIMKNYPIEKSKLIEANPGDVLFFHYFTLHGSMPNRSNQIRKTVLIQMYNGNDKVEEGNKHPNEKLVLNGWNYHSTRSSAGQSKF